MDIPEEDGLLGCGSCGNVWDSEEALVESIEKMAAKYEHRRAVYRKAKGKWIAISKKREPQEYVALVESENWIE